MSRNHLVQGVIKSETQTAKVLLNLLFDRLNPAWITYLEALISGLLVVVAALLGMSLDDTSRKPRKVSLTFDYTPLSSHSNFLDKTAHFGYRYRAQNTVEIRS